MASQEEKKPEAAKPSPATETRMILVRSNSRARIGQEVVIGPHTLLSDEPDPVGEDTGPTPHDLLAAALGSCTAMTLTLYARRKEWPLESVSVILKHEKINAADCVGCRTREGKVDHIERAIQLGGPLSEEQRSRLLEIADRCPVRRTLDSEVHIESHLV
jgi:putative redox protein